MNEQTFHREMHKARTLQRFAKGTYESEYWSGYQRGLRRAYYGSDFGTAGEHRQWMKLYDSSDKRRHERGRGYRDGLAVGKIPKGRPPVGDTRLPAIHVPDELADAMKKKAKNAGITIPDGRREAYMKWVDT